MKCVYVAGPYSSDNVMGVLENMRKGMRMATKVFLAGFAPFCPWIDYHFALMVRGDERLTVDQYYQYSMAWLERSDAVLVLPGSERSRGTQAELQRARELGIPIYHTLDDLIREQYTPDHT